MLPLNGEETVTLAGVHADDLLGNLELRVYPAGSASADTSVIAFHDGSTIRLEEAPGRLTLAFARAPRIAGTSVRLPGRFAVTQAIGDGSAFDVASPGTLTDRWVEEGGATAIEIPAGVTRSEIAFE